MDLRVHSEPIGDGGYLHVRADGWFVQWVIPGPDRRYNSSSITFFGGKFREIIRAYRGAFERYEKLKATLPVSGTFTERLECGLQIVVNGPFDGVSLASSRYAPINTVQTRAALEERLAMYEKALERAAELKELFKAPRA